MHGSLRCGLGAGVLAIAALCVSTLSLAQSAKWTGTWGAPGCSRDDITIKLDRKELDLSTFETSCLVRRVRERGGLVELEASCSSEGEQKRGFFKLKVDGSSLTFVEQRGFPFTPKRFRRCEGREARGDRPAPLSARFASECVKCLNEALSLGRSVATFCRLGCDKAYETMVCDNRGVNCRPGP